MRARLCKRASLSPRNRSMRAIAVSAAAPVRADLRVLREHDLVRGGTRGILIARRHEQQGGDGKRQSLMHQRAPGKKSGRVTLQSRPR